MLRTSVVKLAQASRLPAYRSFSVAAARMGEGDTGAPRSGGLQSGDAWTKKESAQENLFIRQKEIEKLRLLKEKLKQQRQHLDELDAHIDELTRSQGGEQH
ncbi:ATPase inhibitor [Ophidiomyces ophidiicola]|nr:ATPase inhibitor [Ophidiomyces ophidiicola]KAI1963397.1 ATPase inhibitor [Ophidiomyces ophidiicola]